MELSKDEPYVEETKKHEIRYIICTHCGHEIRVPISCGDRFCSTCNGASRKRAADRIRATVKATPKIEGHRWRFCTFTIPTRANAQEAVEEVIRQFRRLRQRKWWRDRVFGGMYVIEATWSKNRWHVHIHALVYSRYLPVFTLAQKWRSCGAGSIVHITQVSSGTIFGYLTKYLSKQAVPMEQRDEINVALSGKRLYSVFGAAHDLQISIVKVSYQCPDCSSCQWMPERAIAAMFDRAKGGNWTTGAT